MALMHEAQADAITRLGDMQQSIEKSIVTRPAVGEKASPDEANRSYVLTRNNDYEIGALVSQYGLKRTIAMLKDGERKLQRREGG